MYRLANSQIEFAIEIEKIKGHQSTKLKDLKMYHGKCGGKLEIKKSKSSYDSDYGTAVSLFCEKCGMGTILFKPYELANFEKELFITAIIGKEKKIRNCNHRIESNNSIFRKRLERIGIVLFTVTQIEPKENPEEKIKEKTRPRGKDKKTIKELKTKLMKLEQAKKETEEEAEKLKEKLLNKEKVKEFYCPYCGSKLIVESSFCSFCGANIKNRIKEMEKVSISNK